MNAHALLAFLRTFGAAGQRLLPLVLSVAPLLGQRHDDVVFRHQANLAPGYSVYLLGNLDALGGGDLARSLRMIQRTPGNWEITVRLPVNTTYQSPAGGRRPGASPTSLRLRACQCMRRRCSSTHRCRCI